MYYASTHTRQPKRKLGASVVTTDGDVFEGYFFVTGDQRVKDLLNGESQFVPFETLGGAMYILNRNSISRVVPRQASVETLETPEPEQAQVA